jgi:hypothetical protein
MIADVQKMMSSQTKSIKKVKTMCANLIPAFQENGMPTKTTVYAAFLAHDEPISFIMRIP